jgi:hypothetical protein
VLRSCLPPCRELSAAHQQNEVPGLQLVDVLAGLALFVCRSFIRLCLLEELFVCRGGFLMLHCTPGSPPQPKLSCYTLSCYTVMLHTVMLHCDASMS